MGSAGERKQAFEELKAGLLQKGKLFEDPDFPADASAINPSSSYAAHGITWKRPKEISANPQFVVKGATRFDLNQGELQDCWFVAATACLASCQPQLLERCVPHNQDFNKDYAGIFRFKFWQFGEWIEVVVDDRLPTRGNRLVYARNTGEPNEFWVPLFEKAYAKSKGCYDNLNGGFAHDALVDFTGGISEFVDIKPKRQNPGHLFDRLYAMIQKYSLVCTHIDSKRIPEQSLPNGLYCGHAYSITNLVKLKIKGSQIRLLRIRNPWGRGEWKGRWSDKSPDWTSIPEKVQEEIGRANIEDGEFWMSFEDWLENFERLTICHFDPESAQCIASEKHREFWEMEVFKSEWVRGFSAGGCGNKPYQNLFWSNPQFVISIAPKDAEDGGSSHVVIALMQKTLNNRPKFAISFSLYQLKKDAVMLLSGQNYDSGAMVLVKEPQPFRTLRDVSEHYRLNPGKYVAVPCTYEPNQESQFLLRIFTESKSEALILDIPTSLAQETKSADSLTGLFSGVTGGDLQMDARELVQALNSLFSRNTETTVFGVESARNILAMADKERSGFLTFEAFRGLVSELMVWNEKFSTFDSDRSGDIDTFELNNLFDSIGFSVSRQVLESIVRRYGGRKSRLSFVDFFHCASKIVALYNRFVETTKDGASGVADFNLEQWLSTTMYY